MCFSVCLLSINGSIKRSLTPLAQLAADRLERSREVSKPDSLLPTEFAFPNRIRLIKSQFVFRFTEHDTAHGAFKLYELRSKARF